MKAKRIAAVLVLCSSSVLLPEYAYAAGGDLTINQRQHRQHHRIQQGVRSGELTRDEAQTLRREQREIRAEERDYRADGKLTRGERRELQRELNEASQNIHEEKHDVEERR